LNRPFPKWKSETLILTQFALYNVVLANPLCFNGITCCGICKGLFCSYQQDATSILCN
jgi:hypothetical protein